MLALAVPVLTVLVHRWFGFRDDDPAFGLFLVPAIVSAYVGGLGPGLLATIVIAIVTNSVFLSPLANLATAIVLLSGEWLIVLVEGVLVSVLLEALHRARQRAEASRELLDVTLTSIGDAVISTDIDGRVRFLNAEAARLTGWSLAEALGQPLALVFRIINAQSRMPAGDPATKVLQSGAVVGLANHTLLLGRDGRETPIDDSGAPIRHPNGALAGVVLVFRDIAEREQADAALRASEARYRQIVETTQEGIWQLDATNTITFVNAKIAAILGYTVDEMIGMPVFAFIAPENQAQAQVNIERRRQGIAEQHDFKLLRNDGTAVWALINATPIVDPTGNYAGTFAMVTDITERKHAEAMLRQSEARFAAAFHASSAAMLLTRAEDGRFIDVNASYERLFGYRRDELIGQTGDALRIYIYPEQRAEIVRSFREQGSLHDMELILRARSGELRTVLSSLESLDLAGETCLLGTMVDITERKRAEQAQARSAARLHVLADASRIFAEASADYQSLLGQVARTIAVSLGDFCTIRLLSDDRQWLSTAALYNAGAEALAPVQLALAQAPTPMGALQPLWDVLQSDRALILPALDPAQIQATLRLEDRPALDQINDYIRVAAPLRIGGQPAGLLAVARKRSDRPAFDEDDLRLVQDLADRAALTIAKARLLQQLQQELAERQKAEAEIRQLNADLEQRVAARTAELEAANKELEAFSYSISHDLRAPLRAIDGFARILLEDYTASLPDQAQQYFQYIRENAQRMGQLVDDLLAFSRLSRLPLNKRSVDTAALVRQCLHELSDEQVGRQVEIRVGELPACVGDPALLRQVWFNLLANALKYTRKCERAEITIGSQTESGETVYFVRDNGAGFDMRYANKLFGVFQRLHRAEDYEGTGVGLAIVHRIVVRHGGRVWADAAVDQGATFFFTL